MKRYLFIFLSFATVICAMEEVPTTENNLAVTPCQRQILPAAEESNPPSSLLMALPHELKEIIIRFAIKGEEARKINRLLYVSQVFSEIVKSYVLLGDASYPSLNNKKHNYNCVPIYGDQDLRAIRISFTNLRVLEIGTGSKITDAGIEHLTPLIQLETLSIGSQIRMALPYKGPIQITDKGAQLISTLSKLTHLTLENTAITAESIKHLASLLSLTYLDLNYNNLGNKSGGYWTKFKNSQLETLCLRGARLKRRDMINIATLGSLKNLDLRENSLYPTRFKFLSNMNHLKKLLLSNLLINYIRCSIHYLPEFERTYGSDQEYLDAWQASKRILSSKLNNIVTFT